MPGHTQSQLAGVKDVAAPVPAQVELDEVDLALLRALSAEGRASLRQLAAALGVSAPTVTERMAKLERAGVIIGYATQIDWSAVGYPETVYLSVTAAPDGDVAAVMTSMWALPEVEDVNLITGDLDLLVRLRVRDHTHLRSLLMDRIWQIDGIQGTSTLLSVAGMPAKSFAEGLLAQMADEVGHRR
jgi:Lrp/AsnC family transcriptional regulator, leucine-responsive regulatory protein